MRKDFDMQDPFTTEDTEDTEEKQNEEKTLGVKRKVPVRKPAPPTLAATDHDQLMKQCNLRIFCSCLSSVSSVSSVVKCFG